jgi:hypothetical protein
LLIRKRPFKFAGSANLKEDGSRPVAQVDNTASTTETTDAPHGAEAAAVEQPALSEASPALEVPSEPAPAPAVGSETVAQIDNTASATETTEAPHGAKAAAVEQPALSEASPALEVSSEPAPAPAVAVDEEGQAATEHGGPHCSKRDLPPEVPPGRTDPTPSAQAKHTPSRCEPRSRATARRAAP